MVLVTISGKYVPVSGNRISAANLLKKLLLATGNPKAPDGHYFCPRQNRPNGLMLSDTHEFNLEECSDFILVSVPVR